jgi:hypothetical protein
LSCLTNELIRDWRKYLGDTSLIKALGLLILKALPSGVNETMCVLPSLSASAKRRYSFPGNNSTFPYLPNGGGTEIGAAAGSVELGVGVGGSRARLSKE